ncbi:TetR/AcrR family transcriptional regulator [Phenylobacterium sp.]|uniref:TetR/AcrR family transcriptional regulator n=1 Tax=Phenylobacterium sp. TaxID=1871053 RepID=UPI00374D29C6
MPPPPPRKSPRQQRSRQTVEVVLEAAAHILEDGGLARFNTNAVAARAGVSVGSIYQYFPDKDAVMTALIRREAARFDGALERALAGAADLPLDDAIGGLIAVAVRHQTERPNLARILDLEERRLGLEEQAEAATAAALNRLTAFLETRGVWEPAVSAADLLNLARGMIDGALGDDPADLSRRVRRAILGYLAAGPQPSKSNTTPSSGGGLIPRALP